MPVYASSVKIEEMQRVLTLEGQLLGIIHGPSHSVFSVRTWMRI